MNVKPVTGITWAQPSDDLAMLNSLIAGASNGTTLTLPRKTWHLSGSVTVLPGKANLTIDFNGGQIVWLNAGSGDNLYGIKVGMQAGNPLGLDATTPTKRSTIDDNITVKYVVNAPSTGATTITINDTVTTAPAAGDIWVLYDLQQVIDVGSGPTTTANRTWLFKVGSYNAGSKVITVDASSGACPHAFTGTVKIAKLNGVATYGSCENITIRNLNVVGRALSNRAMQRYIIHAQCVHGLTVDNVKFSEVQTGAVNAFACTNVTVTNCRVERMGLSGGGEGVGFWFHGCSRVTCSRLYGRSLRHLVEFADGSADGLVTESLCEQQDPSGAAWDTHGGGEARIEFRSVRGGYVHLGNATYPLGGTNLKLARSDVNRVRIQGSVGLAELVDSEIEQGVTAITLFRSPTHYAPLDVRITGCYVGTVDDGGCIRFAGTGGGIPKATNILVENCLVRNTESTSTYCPGIDITNWNTSSGTLTVRNCVFDAPNRTDAKDIVRLWGDDTNMSIGTLTLLIEDCSAYNRTGKLLNIRSSAGRVGGGTVTVRRNGLFNACTAETTGGLTSSWNSAASLSASRNSIRKW